MLEEKEMIVVLVGFVISFMLAFGIGANDVANSFGTSVGSKVLTLKAACILATVCETLGAVLLGSRVSKTIRSDIVNLTLYNNSQNGAKLLAYGDISALASSCIWLFVATFFKFPVSGTHSIVGSTAGFSLVLFGVAGVQWMSLIKIAISWFVSPLLSGLVSTMMFIILKKVVLVKNHPLEPALHTLPFLYGIVILINVFSVSYGLIKIKSNIWILGIVMASLLSGIITGLIVYFLVIPCLRRKITRKAAEAKLHDISDFESIDSKKSKSVSKYFPTSFCMGLRNDLFQRQNSGDSSLKPDARFPVHIILPDAEPRNKDKQIDARNLKSEPLRTVASTTSIEGTAQIDTGTLANLEHTHEGKSYHNSIVSKNVNNSKFSEQLSASGHLELFDRPEEAQVFSFTQILTATFGSFAHGGNDVSNAIGPLIGLWIIKTTGNVESDTITPIWILFYGGIGISVGLWMYGRRVIETIGEDLSLITPSSGVCIEIGSALTVLIASKIGIPVSTTHCKVGSVICVGRIRSKENVNWRLFVNIIVAWVVTVPISLGLSALVMYILQKANNLSV